MELTITPFTGTDASMQSNLDWVTLLPYLEANFAEWCRQSNLQLTKVKVEEPQNITCPRVYIVYVKINDDSAPIDSQTLNTLARQFGESWTELVRSLLDSGALIALVLESSTTSLKWSPHGTH